MQPTSSPGVLSPLVREKVEKDFPLIKSEHTENFLPGENIICRVESAKVRVHAQVVCNFSRVLVGFEYGN